MATGQYGQVRRRTRKNQRHTLPTDYMGHERDLDLFVVNGTLHAFFLTQPGVWRPWRRVTTIRIRSRSSVHNITTNALYGYKEAGTSLSWHHPRRLPRRPGRAA
jgi:hypothetical protein